MSVWANLSKTSPVFQSQNNTENKKTETEQPKSIPESVSTSNSNFTEFVKSWKISSECLFDPVCAGLENRENICFLNSVYQVLFHLRPFWTLVRLSRNFPIPKEMKIFKNLTEFSKLFGEIESKKAGTLAPIGTLMIPYSTFYNLLWDFNPKRHPKQHEDAQEFLIFLLQRLDEELSTIFKATNFDDNLQNKKEEEDWLEVGKKNKANKVRWIEEESNVHNNNNTNNTTSPIRDLFSGRLRVSVKKQNEVAQTVVEPFFTLSLDILDNNSLVEAFQNYFLKESVNVADKYGKTQSMLDKLPFCLILHLKRFYWNDAEGNITKSDRFISYPAVLELSSSQLKRIGSVSLPTDNPVRYQLYAFIQHHGRSPHSGHYTTVLKKHNQWMLLDDRVVTRITNPEQVLQKLPYLLFYCREQ